MGRTDSCSPYVAKRNGGRGGERWLYGATGWFRYGMPPVAVIVRSKKTGKEVRLLRTIASTGFIPHLNHPTAPYSQRSPPRPPLRFAT